MGKSDVGVVTGVMGGEAKSYVAFKRGYGAR
jgi:hypothetical protein